MMINAWLVWLLLTAGDPARASAAETFLEHVKFLADDALKGRETGSPENDRAAAYIADRLRSAGAEPAGDRGFLQPFKAMEGRQLAAGNSLSLNGEALQLERDYLPLITAESGQVSGKLVFAGYGIHAPELNYDDLAGVDLKGRVILVITGGPGTDASGAPSPFREGEPGFGHTSVRSKISSVYAAGAAAVLIVNDPRALKQEGKPDVIESALLQQGLVPSIPAVRLTLAAVADRLAHAELDLASLQAEIDRTRTPRSRESKAEIALTVKTEPVFRDTQNVVGTFRGADPALAQEAVVVGAHYDHIGFGKRFSAAAESDQGQIHNGADDNASGVAALLLVADEVGRHKSELKRSVVLVAFSGEEWGLLGSSHYVKHPVVPLDHTAAMINFDMVGRSKDGYLAVIGVGSSPGFRSLVERENAADGGRFHITFDEGSIGNSDHQSFLSAGVPALFFFSGLHEDYHRPTDDWQKINAAGGAQIAELAGKVLHDLDVAAERPAFTPVKSAEMRISEAVKQATAKNDPHSGQATGSPYGPWFGSVPSFANDGSGVLFDDVRAGSPAAKADLRKGDKMIEFGGVPVRTLEDFTVLLRSHKIGDEVDVVVLRGTERVTAKVTLAKKP